MTAVAEQAQLLNTDTKEFNPYWVDPKGPLLVPVNPLHYAAHKYQLILERLDNQAIKNPAQFNSGNYILIMEKLEKLWQAINEGKTVNDLDEGKVATSRHSSPAQELGDRVAPGLDPGISADNPITG